MNNILLNDDDYHDTIRTPDPIKKEQLIERDCYEETINNNWKNEDDELKQVLELSKEVYDLLQEEEEKKSIEYIQQETQKRIQKFESIKHKINKLLLFDRTNSGQYETILSIISLYENEYTSKYIMNKEEYDIIFKLLRTIRLTNLELEHLTVLIVCED